MRFRIHSFVVTLGTMLIWRGILIALTGGFPMTVEIPQAFKDLDGRAAARRLPDVDALVHRHRPARDLPADPHPVRQLDAGRGQNPQAARNLGVPVDRVTVILFMIASALAAVPGVIQVARFASVDALRGEGMELQAVAVTVIGGTLLSGGYGSVVGTVLGAITFGMIQVGLVLAGAPGHLFRTLTGLIVVAAVILNTDVARRHGPLAAARRLPAQQRGGGRGDRAAARARRSARRRERRRDQPGPRPSMSSARCQRPHRRDGRSARIQPIPPDAVPVDGGGLVSKGFGATTALVDVSLKAYAGRILALLGDNGAGKSTLIKILSGVFPPDRGELRFRGEPVVFADPGRGARTRHRHRASRTSRSASCSR